MGSQLLRIANFDIVKLFMPNQSEFNPVTDRTSKGEHLNGWVNRDTLDLPNIARDSIKRMAASLELAAWCLNTYVMFMLFFQIW